MQCTESPAGDGILLLWLVTCFWTGPPNCWPWNSLPGPVLNPPMGCWGSRAIVRARPNGNHTLQHCSFACMSRMSASHAVPPYSAQAFTVCLKAAGSYPQCRSVFSKEGRQKHSFDDDNNSKLKTDFTTIALAPLTPKNRAPAD
uniref:Secreted protein n=1 Tax=Coccidioides posadasii RMSCC 3488 TaxID=454284 RepID=A0A0J6FMB6_COCPO|nr:hypothetical protein CPAG_06336 [Coccidioides posadasii RMSCC 3488]